MKTLLGKVLSKSIQTETEISIVHGLDDPTEVTCEKGTTFEIAEDFLHIEEHYFLWKDHEDHSKGRDEHIIYHLFRVSDIQYIGAA